jgi:hypothetical protein
MKPTTLRAMLLVILAVSTTCANTRKSSVSPAADLSGTRPTGHTADIRGSDKGDAESNGDSWGELLVCESESEDRPHGFSLYFNVFNPDGTKLGDVLIDGLPMEWRDDPDYRTTVRLVGEFLRDMLPDGRRRNPPDKAEFDRRAQRLQDVFRIAASPEQANESIRREIESRRDQL